MFETSKIELSQSAFRHNLKFIRKQLKKETRLCSVVKGNAYGHGISEFVSMAFSSGVDYFAVHSADEAFALKSSVPKVKDIFIMGEINGIGIDWAVNAGVEFSIYDFDRLNEALKAARTAKKKAKIHVEVETGMLRTGFDVHELEGLIKQLIDNSEYLELVGLFTHFAGAESLANHFRIVSQLTYFNKAVRLFEEAGIKPKYVHSSCSAAVLNYPDAPGNMVRIGILQYGFWPNQETNIRFCGDDDSANPKLKRIIKWTTSIMAIKQVKKGSFVGYGTAYLAHKDQKLAIIPVGYSHGYGRSLSNTGSVLIKGRVANVVGTVNMNSITVDVTHIKNVHKGDEVVLIGKQGNGAITVNSFSEQSQLLNYELLTRLPYAIPRVVKR